MTNIDVENQKVDVHFYKFGLSEKIEDLFIVDELLILVSKTKIFEIDILFCNESITITQIFDPKSNANTDLPIKDVKYSVKHNMFYLLLREKKGENSAVAKFKINYGNIEELTVKELEFSVNFFEIHQNDIEIVYVATDHEVLEISLKKKGENDIEEIQFKEKQIKEQNMKNKKQGKRNKAMHKELESLRYKKIYKSPKQQIKFFKFREYCIVLAIVRNPQSVKGKRFRND